MTDWRTSRLAAGVIIALFVTIQLAVPIGRLQSDGAQRFGWQMYSAAYHNPTFIVTSDAGDREIDLDEYVAVGRADVDLVTWLPPHLCRLMPEITTVTWEEGSYQC